jgi:ribosomal protein S18 acetylase RimI-like enzyme
MSVAAYQSARSGSTSGIRRLVPADATGYRSLMLEAYERHPEVFTSSVAERTALPLAFWEGRLKDEPRPMELVLGAFVDGRLAGIAGLAFESRDKTRHKARLFGMYVLPALRQGGIGYRLVLAALDAARAREGVKLVQLTVTHGNGAAQALYERCGFVPFGIEPFAVAVGSEFVSKVHMWCDIGVTSKGTP